jgi:tetratricopeptide (TPR) repeat protein
VPVSNDSIPQELIESPILDSEIPDDTLDVSTDSDIESWLNSLPEVPPSETAQVPPEKSSEPEPIEEFNQPEMEAVGEIHPPAQIQPADTAPLVGYDDEFSKAMSSPLDELEEAAHFQSLTNVQEAMETLSSEPMLVPEPVAITTVETPQAPTPAKNPETNEEMLEFANNSVADGNLNQAIEYFSKLIHKGKNLDDTIQSLRSAVYRYPTEVSIWQSLGDGYAKVNRLQEALEAYTKAEELLS